MHMKWSILYNIIATISGTFGILALIGAWTASSSGTAFGFTQSQLYNDAHGLILLAILFAIGTLVHHNNEDDKKNSKLI